MSIGFEPMTSTVLLQCSTNWAKEQTGSWSLCWFFNKLVKGLTNDCDYIWESYMWTVYQEINMRAILTVWSEIGSKNEIKSKSEKKFRSVQDFILQELITTIVIIQNVPAPPPPPAPSPYRVYFPFPALWCATNTLGSNSCPLPPLLTVLKHLRMFNAHFQFSLFLWYDINVKQRYCYGYCAEIGSFMPQAVPFPEKTTVV